MNLLSYLFKHSKVISIIAILLGLASGISRTAFVITVNKFIPLQTTSSLKTSLFLIFFAVLMSFFNIVSQLLLNKISLTSIYGLRLHFSKQIMSLNIRKIENIGTSSLKAVLTQDIQNIANALTISPTMLIYITTIISGLIYMAILSVNILFLWAFFLTIGMFIYNFVNTKVLYLFEKGRNEEDSLFKYFETLINNTKEFKNNWSKRYNFFNNLLQISAQKDKHYSIKGMDYFTQCNGFSEFLLFLFISVLIGFSSVLLHIEHTAVISIVMLFFFLISPVIILLNILPTITKGMSSVNKLKTFGISLKDIMDSTDLSIEETINNKRSLHVFDHFKNLTVTNICFKYHNEYNEDLFRIGPINIEFKPGQIIFLIGGNGSGKTTLAKVIAGLYAPDKGDITLDGKLITDADRDWYRQLFSTVWVDFYLNDKLLTEQTLYTDETITNYLKKLRLDHKVTVRNGVLSTVQLSQGQKKRLALLNCWLEDKPFYIFDEWAADQDPVFKDIFYSELLVEMKNNGKTILAITHDSHYFHIADKVLFLDYGTLKENLEDYSQKKYYTIKPEV